MIKILLFIVVTIIVFLPVILAVLNKVKNIISLATISLFPLVLFYRLILKYYGVPVSSIPDIEQATIELNVIFASVVWIIVLALAISDIKEK